MRQQVSLSQGHAQEVQPVAVHCTAGVGRTGVIILTDLMIACLQSNQVTWSNVYFTLIDMLFDQENHRAQKISTYNLENYHPSTSKVVLFFFFVTASKYPQVTDSPPMPENAVSNKLRPISLCIYHPHSLPQK